MSNEMEAKAAAEEATASHQEEMHFGILTEEELIIEKKLRRKIDMRIMPVVITVYLMNYIDRSASPSLLSTVLTLTMRIETTTLLPNYRAWLRICIWLATNIRPVYPSFL